MAVLSKFRRNASLIQDGQWIEVGEAGETFEIFTRGSTEPWNDALAKSRHKALRELNRKRQPGTEAYDLTTLPPSVENEVYGRALVDHCVRDVRGLYHDEAKTRPVLFAEFCDMLLDSQQFAPLIGIALAAVGRVNENAAADRADAVGNSPSPSATASFSPTSEPT